MKMKVKTTLLSVIFAGSFVFAGINANAAEIDVNQNVFGQIATADGGRAGAYLVDLGNVLNIETSVEFSDNTGYLSGGAIKVWGTSGDEGTLIMSDNVSFVGNKVYSTIENSFALSPNARRGGAIANWGTLEMGDYALFENNIIDNKITSTGNGNRVLTTGGAIFNNGDATIGNYARFLNNKALNDPDSSYGNGGAINNYAGSFNIGDHVLFSGNQVVGNGGAIKNEDSGEFTIGANSVFENNVALDNNMMYTGTPDENYASGGGAIYNIRGAEFILGDNAVFRGNLAQGFGGAIYNNATIEFLGSAEFTNNTIKLPSGGAIYNDDGGTITFGGNVIFSGNVAKGVLNDIHNLGTLNFAANSEITLDGGITESGNITFGDGSRLTAKLFADRAAIAANLLDIGNGSKIAGLVISDGVTGAGIKLFERLSGTGDFNYELNNPLYNITYNGDGLFDIYKKPAEEQTAAVEELAKEAGVNSNAANVVVGLVAGDSNNPTFNNIAEQISDLVQSGNSSDAKKGLEGALALAPSVAPVVNSNAQEGVKQLFNAIGQRLSGATGRAGGFEFNDAGVWAQGLYNKSELRMANGFNGRSAGIAVGIDGKISDEAMLGFGLAYTNSKIDSTNRKTTSDNYSLSIYGEQTFEEDLFVNGILSYGFANYDESKNVLGFNVGADYNVNSLAAQITGGRHFKNSATDSVFTPEIGARYLLISQGSYTDGAGQKISSDTSNALTGVAGLRFKTGEFSDGKGLRLIPELKVAGTWDAVSADNSATVVLPNNSSYKINGEELDRLGLEAGFKIGLEVKNVFVSLAYEGRFKQDYADHTGLLNVRYNF